MKTALILFAHGARDPEWAEPMRRVQAAICRRAPEQQVALAFLEFMTPTLPECVADLIGQGVKRISVLPLFIARGGHLKRELPEMMESLRASFPAVEFVLAGAVGEDDAVIEAMAEVALKVIG